MVGGELLKLLGGDRRYAHVVSLVRRALVTTEPIENRVVSFEDLDRYTLPDVDDAYCCLGTTRRTAGSDEAFRRVDLDYVLGYARAAQRAGAVRFLLVSATGANPQSRLLYPRVKGEVEAAVSSLGFSVAGIARPSLLTGHRAEARRGEAAARLASRLVTPFMVGPLRRFRPIEARAVAKGLVHAAFTAPPGVTVLSSEDLEAAATKAPDVRA